MKETLKRSLEETNKHEGLSILLFCVQEHY